MFRSDQLLSSLVQRIRSAQRQRLQDGGVSAGIRTRSELCPDAKYGREERRLEQFTPVVVDLVLKTGIALSIGTRLPLQDDRTAVWHDQSGPDQEDARLAERDLAVVHAD